MPTKKFKVIKPITKATSVTTYKMVPFLFPKVKNPALFIGT